METARFKPLPATAWPLLLATTITWCSGHPAAVPDVEWLAIDKVGHFVAYGTLATAIIRIPRLRRWPLLGWWWALPLASVYGIGDEIRQSLTHGIRSPDWHDWVADTVGAVLATALYVGWPRYRVLLERSPRRKVAKPRIETGQEPLRTDAA